MITAVHISLILVSIALITMVTLQAKGSGLGGMFGGADAVYKSRRGAEKTLFQLTIVFSIVFILLDIVAVLIHVP